MQLVMSQKGYADGDVIEELSQRSYADGDVTEGLCRWLMS